MSPRPCRRATGAARWLLVLTTLSTSGCAGAQVAPPDEGPAPPVSGSVNPRGEQLLAQPPSGWQQVGATNLPTLKRAEFLPADETPEAWASRITFEAMVEDPLPDPIEFVDLLAADRQNECDTFERLPTFSGEENGYPTTVDLLVCHHDRETDRSEVLLMKTIRGNDAFYIVTRGRRGPPVPDGGKPAVEDVEVGAWALYLKTVGVCDDSREGHPCPAATPGSGDKSE